MKHPKTYDYVKRGIDIVGSISGLIVLSPVIAVSALAVRANLGSPVLFKQQRPGLNGKIFTLYKFRSMRDINPDLDLITPEQRMTAFGQKFRATSLDELPSLINVLKGDMSLVGPRPLLVEYLARYTPEQARRHEVRPGVTGLAQVNGRNELEWDKRFILDVEYVEKRSLLLDLKILFKTVLIAFKRSGITAEGHVVGQEFKGNQPITTPEIEKQSSKMRPDA